MKIQYLIAILTLGFAAWGIHALSSTTASHAEDRLELKEAPKPDLDKKVEYKVELIQKGDVKIEGLTAKLIVHPQSGTVVSNLPQAPKGNEPRPMLDRTRKYPAASKAHLILRITNTTRKTIQINHGSDMEQLDLTVSGKGARTVNAVQMFTMEMRMGQWKDIAPGKSIDIPLNQLSHGKRGVAMRSYFTQPGHYKIDYSYRIPFRTKAHKAPHDSTMVTFTGKDLEIQAFGEAEAADSVKIVKKVPVKITPLKPSGIHQLTANVIMVENTVSIVNPENQNKNVPSQVHLKLEISTESKAGVYINQGADANRLSLKLKGKGAKTELTQSMFTEEFRMGQWIKVTPEKPYILEIKGLSHGHRMQEYYSYATQPGTYQLSIDYKVMFKASEKSKEQALTLQSKPVSLKAKAVQKVEAEEMLPQPGIIRNGPQPVIIRNGPQPVIIRNGQGIRTAPPVIRPD